MWKSSPQDKHWSAWGGDFETGGRKWASHEGTKARRGIKNRAFGKSAREWGEWARMLGGLTSVSAEVLGTQRRFNPCRLKNGNRTIPPSNAGRILRVSELGRFGETTLPFFLLGADGAAPSSCFSILGQMSFGVP